MPDPTPEHRLEPILHPDADTAERWSPDLPAPLHPPSPGPSLFRQLLFGPEGLRAGWGILLFLLIFVGGSILVSHLHLVPHQPHPAPGAPAPELPAGYSILAESISLGLILFATAAMSRVEGRPFGVYGLAASPTRLGTRSASGLFTAGLVWGITLLSLLVLVLWQTHLLIFDHLLLAGPEIPRYAAVWSLGFLVVALFEELFLRGYLQYTLTRGLAALFRAVTSPDRAHTLGFWAAALILSSIFGLGHRTNPGESPIGLFAAALVGLVFTFSLWRTGSLWWAIGLHTSWDWAQSFLYGVADSGTMVQHHLLASHPAGRPLFSGGTTGPEGSLYVLPTLALVALVVFLTLSPSPEPSPAPQIPASAEPR